MEYLPRIILWVVQKWTNRKKSVDVSTECIINKTIEDLNPSNIANWEYSIDGMYYYRLRNKRKKYSISVSNYRSTAHINGVSWNIFTESQQRRLFHPAAEMIRAIKAKEIHDGASHDKKTLAKLFPECVK